MLIELTPQILPLVKHFWAFGILQVSKEIKYDVKIHLKIHVTRTNKYHTYITGSLQSFCRRLKRRTITCNKFLLLLSLMIK